MWVVVGEDVRWAGVGEVAISCVPLGEVAILCDFRRKIRTGLPPRYGFCTTLPPRHGFCTGLPPRAVLGVEVAVSCGSGRGCRRRRGYRAAVGWWLPD